MRNSNIILKLSNILYKFDEFYVRYITELDLNSKISKNFEILYEQWKDLSKSGQFHPEQNYTESIEIIEFCMDNFRYFKNIFDYTETQMLAICPGLTISNYGAIYDKLIEHYNIKGEMNTVGVGGYDVDFDSVMEPDLSDNLTPTPISIIEEYVSVNSYFDSECSVDEDGDEEILFTTRQNGIVGAEMYGMEDYKAGIKLVDDLNLFYGNELSFELETVDEWIHIWGKRK